MKKGNSKNSESNELEELHWSTKEKEKFTVEKKKKKKKAKAREARNA
jgi:hypothetical protein